MGRPKPLLEWRGEPFLKTQIRLYQEAGCAVHIVLGREAADIAAACPATSTAVLLLNPEPDRGMLSSLKIALSALPAATPAALFTPVDNPGVLPATVRSMLSLWREKRSPLVIPRHEAKRGHPVLIDAGAIAALLAWPDESTPRDFIRSQHHLAAWADVDDARVTLDIDTPDQYEAFLLREARP
jgi:molybdenum cofactor cytidylyltransferase